MAATSSPKGDFQPFQAEESDFTSESDSKELTDGRFQTDSGVWNALLADPKLAAEWDRRVKAEAQQCLKRQNEELLESVKQEAKKQGFEEGVQQAQEVVRASSEVLDQAVKQLLQQKSQLLHDHEGAISKGIVHVLKRFLTPFTTAHLPVISAWVRETLGSAIERGKIQLFFSEGDFETIQSAYRPTGTENWEVLQDSSLSPRSVRCQTNLGNMSFDSDEQLKKLESALGKQVIDANETGS